MQLGQRLGAKKGWLQNAPGRGYRLNVDMTGSFDEMLKGDFLTIHLKLLLFNLLIIPSDGGGAICRDLPPRQVSPFTTEKSGEIAVEMEGNGHG